MKWILLFIALFISIQVNAANINAEIEGGPSGRIKWDNAYSVQANTYVPSTWDIVSGLLPTKKWVPGGLSLASADSIKIINAGVEVNLPIKIIGFEYNTGSASPTEGEIETGTTICGSTSFNSPIASVAKGVNCSHSKQLVTSVAYSPYSFIRPIFEVDETAIVAAFDGKPAGTYLGSTSVTSFYHFYYDSGIKSKYYHSQVVNFAFRFTPSKITSVTINGNRELIPTYANNKISASTTLDGVASGWFADGLKMSLKSTLNEYFLEGPTSLKIPYSIECIGCDTQSLVLDSVVKNSQVELPARKVSNVPFKLRISYSDIDVTTLDTGIYQDSFVLIFEPRI